MALTQFPINTITPGQAPLAPVVVPTDTLLGTFSGRTQQAPVSSVLAPVNTAIGQNIAQINSLQAQITALAQSISKSNWSTVLSPSGDPTGVTDTAAFIAAFMKAVSNPVLATGGASYVGYGNIYFNPGNFIIIQPYAMMDGRLSLVKMSGLTFEGSGTDSTIISYNPITPGPLCSNRYVLDVQFKGMSLRGGNAGSDFYQGQEQGGVSNIQYNNYEDLALAGSWRNIEILTGGNNNSENRHVRCGIDASVANWLYIPPPATATLVGGNQSIAINNSTGAFDLGTTFVFTTALGNLLANTAYLVIASSVSAIQIALLSGGGTVTPNTSGSLIVNSGSDQILDHWFKDVKFDCGGSNGSMINVSSGGHVHIDDCSIANNQPTVPTYLFNLGGIVHAGGVMQFSCKDTRVEHASNNSLLLSTQWSGGNITFDNLDTGVLQGSRPATQQYVSVAPVNTKGATVTFNDSQLLGQHVYSVNTGGYQFQAKHFYNRCTLLDNPSAGNFIVNVLAGSGNGNTGGFPVIEFEGCSNTLNSSNTGYQEEVDCSVNWNLSASGLTKVRSAVLVNASGGFPTGGTMITKRLPLNSHLLGFTFYTNGSGTGGAFQYTVQTRSGTVLGGGAATPMAGSNASTPIAKYQVTLTTPLVLSSDVIRDIQLIDTLAGGRTGLFNGVFFTLEFKG